MGVNRYGKWKGITRNVTKRGVVVGELRKEKVREEREYNINNLYILSFLSFHIMFGTEFA